MQSFERLAILLFPHIIASFFCSLITSHFLHQLSSIFFCLNHLPLFPTLQIYSSATLFSSHVLYFFSIQFSNHFQHLVAFLLLFSYFLLISCPPDSLSYFYGILSFRAHILQLLIDCVPVDQQSFLPFCLCHSHCSLKSSFFNKSFF